MKVGIITFHQALNYGAVLQAYALQKAIEGLGHDCEIVDYRCACLTRSYAVLPPIDSGPRGFVSGLVHAPERLARHIRFGRFRAHHLKLSPTSFDRTDIHAVEANYDRFVVGSDQVWNPTLTDGDETYFLSFCDDPRKKVSYAASLGRSGALERHADMYLRGLQSFGSISVREQDAQQYLRALLGREVAWVLDPVLLIEPESFDAITVLPRRSAQYIFAYCLHETDMYRYVDHLRRLTGLPVVYVPESLRTRVHGKRVLSMSPEEFLGWIRGAAYVVTDSFHVVAFSIAFRKVFKAQLKSAFPELNSRITSLLGRIGMEAQLISEDDYQSPVPPSADYSRAEVLLAAAKRESLGFLVAALGCQVGR